MKAIITNRYLLAALLIIGLVAIVDFSGVSIDIGTLETAQVATFSFVILTGLLSWATLNELKKLTAVTVNK